MSMCRRLLCPKQVLANSANSLCCQRPEKITRMAFIRITHNLNNHSAKQRRLWNCNCDRLFQKVFNFFAFYTARNIKIMSMEMIPNWSPRLIS